MTQQTPEPDPLEGFIVVEEHLTLEEMSENGSAHVEPIRSAP